jgi:hypothetical protein
MFSRGATENTSGFGNSFISTVWYVLFTGMEYCIIINVLNVRPKKGVNLSTDR